MPRTNIVGNGEFVAGGEQFVFSLIARCTSFDGVTSIKSLITPRSIRSDLRLIHSYISYIRSTGWRSRWRGSLRPWQSGH